MHIILNRYIRKVILSNIIMVFVILIFLSSLIRLIDELRKVEEQHHFFYEIVMCFFLNLLKDFELFLPVATLLGGLLGLSIFELNNEFIIMQVSGVSKLQIIISVMKASIPILLSSIIFIEWILPRSDQIMWASRKFLQHDTRTVIENSKNLWFMDVDCFFCVKNIITYNELLEVTLYHFDDNKKLRRILFIKRALFYNKIWHLFDVNELDLFAKECVFNKNISYMEWNSVFTPYLLSIMLKHPNVLSVSQLYDCFKYCNKVGQNSNYYQLIFWNKLLSPCYGFIMLILAVSCTFGPLCKKKLNVRLFCGAVVGFVFYMLNHGCGMLSMMCKMSPMIGSMLSIVIFLMISIIIIWKYW